MKYLVINTNQYNGTSNGVDIFNASPILSGIHRGLFASSENALEVFPEIFNEVPYFEADLNYSDFINLYEDKELINGYRLIGVFDTYLGTINIHLFKVSNYDVFKINRPYVNGTWTDEDVENYINEL